MSKTFHAVELECGTFWADHTLPSGHIYLRDAPFVLPKDEDGGLIGMAVFPNGRNEQTSTDLYVDVDNVTKAYFLINCAFGLRVNPATKDEWEGRTIGSIDLINEDGDGIRRKLRLGKNIRDWYPGNFPNSVFKATDDSIKWAWQSIETGAALDILEIDLPANFNLRRISISAKLESVTPIAPATLSELRAELVKTKPKGKYEAELIREEVETSYPRVQVFGITCKTGGGRLQNKWGESLLKPLWDGVDAGEVTVTFDTSEIKGGLSMSNSCNADNVGAQIAHAIKHTAERKASE